MARCDDHRFRAAARTEGRVGAAIPDEASSGLGPPVDLDLRYILSPHLCTACGPGYFQANVSERRGGAAAEQDRLARTSGVDVGEREVFTDEAKRFA
jgi:hypothetical protein